MEGVQGGADLIPCRAGARSADPLRGRQSCNAVGLSLCDSPRPHPAAGADHGPLSLQHPPEDPAAPPGHGRRAAAAQGDEEGPGIPHHLRLQPPDGSSDPQAGERGSRAAAQEPMGVGWPRSGGAAFPLGPRCHAKSYSVPVLQGHRWVSTAEKLEAPRSGCGGE